MHLARLSGQRPMARLLDGWIPGAVEAKSIGLIEQSVEDVPAMSNFLEQAQTLAECWARCGRTRLPRTIGDLPEPL